MQKYRFPDHTADIAIEIFGKNPEELFSNAAEAFTEAFIGKHRLSEDFIRTVQIESQNIEDLMYDWLDELLFIFDTEYEMPARVEKINISGDNGLKLKAMIYFGKVKPDMISVAPKGISLHKFRVEKKDDGYRAFVIIDI